MRWAILIATLPERRKYLDELLAALQPQLVDGVKLQIDGDPVPNIGEKRDRMLRATEGFDYVNFFDDDDLPHPQYVSLIMDALQQDPDCVGFKMRRLYDGVDIGEGINSIRCGGYRNENFTFYRTPGHLNPIRRELAVQTGFKPWDRLEDMDFAERVLPLLKSEVFIDRQLYSYWYRSPRRRQEEQVA